MCNLLKEVKRLSNLYNPGKYTYSSVIKESGIDVSFVSTDDELAEKLSTLPNSVLITDKFLKENYIDPLLSKYNSILTIQVYAISNEDYREVKRIEDELSGCKYSVIIGFGGGRPLDVAKMVSYELNTNLLAIPTTPSHDGIISGSSSLIVEGNKTTMKSKRPSMVIFPEHYINNAPKHLVNSGRCDILGKFTSLQDISLALSRGRDKPEEKYIAYALMALEEILSGTDMKNLLKAILLSGSSMEKSSKYGSGSEHEVEKALAKISNYPHGQLVGAGTLIASKVYEIHAKDMPENLFFNPTKLHEGVVKIFKEKDLYEFVVKPLKEMEEKILIDSLRSVSNIRPERYTLWNEINTEKLDWKNILEEITS